MIRKKYFQSKPTWCITYIIQLCSRRTTRILFLFFLLPTCAHGHACEGNNEAMPRICECGMTLSWPVSHLCLVEYRSHFFSAAGITNHFIALKAPEETRKIMWKPEKVVLGQGELNISHNNVTVYFGLVIMIMYDGCYILNAEDVSRRDPCIWTPDRPY